MALMDTRALEQKLIQSQVVRGDMAAGEIAREVSANAPRDTGRLAAAPSVRRDIGPTSVRWTIGVDVKSKDGFPYDVAQEEGTGVYIGRGPITPKRAKMLRFYWRRVGRVVFARSVRGTPPTRYFSKAISHWVTRLRETSSS